MGRWSQQNRRGGGGGRGAAITPNSVNLISVSGDGVQWTLTFDGPIAAPAGSDAVNFLIGDASFFSNDTSAGNQVFGTDDGSAGYVPGVAWSLTGQPTWLTTTVNFPASGNTI